MAAYRYLAILSFLSLGAILSSEADVLPGAHAAGETPKDVLAAQIGTQGYACDKPQRATRDARQSKPDHDVWILKCENATYRVSRYPDLAAKVERVR